MDYELGELLIELEHLRAENQKLRDALNKIAIGGDVAWHYEDIAREALK